MGGRNPPCLTLFDNLKYRERRFSQETRDFAVENYQQSNDCNHCIIMYSSWDYLCILLQDY